ncbi:MAG TPA: hypothetical protein VFI31_06470 [Pirellulales bacterium]|nr:hypothetical protein [Pirellulales bacterium]
MFTTLVMLFAAGLGSEEVGMKFIASGAYAKASNPAKNPTILVTLSEKVLPIKKAPEGLVSPRYGAVKIGDQSWTVIVEEPEGEPSKLHVDTNADGDLTNDPEPKWTIETNNGSTRYVGEAQLDLGDGNRGTLLLIGSDPSSLRLRFEASDPRLAALKNRLLCRQDYGYEITTKLDGHEFTSYVCGKPNDATSLWIDRDGNGRRSRMQEFIYVGKPFNFTGHYLRPQVERRKVRPR